MDELAVLEAPPRTLDVQQFARARDKELLSLHEFLKNKKRKTPSPHVSDVKNTNTTGNAAAADGGGDDANTFTTTPRHLRRRTSSYRRRQPLPWLYKKKRKATSSSLELSKNKQRKFQGQQQNRGPVSAIVKEERTDDIIVGADVNEALVQQGSLVPSSRGLGTLEDGIGSVGANAIDAGVPMDVEKQSSALPFETSKDVFSLLGMDTGSLAQAGGLVGLEGATPKDGPFHIDRHGILHPMDRCENANAPHADAPTQVEVQAAEREDDASTQVEVQAAQREDVRCISQVANDTSIPAPQVGILEVEQGVSRESNKNQKKKLCRRLRRLIEFKPGGSWIYSDGTRRLATHVWHAKRFSMEKNWGYCIPLGRSGRGHGSRSVLRWYRDRALLQDASFYNAIQLQGREDRIIQVLKLVLESPQGCDFGLEAGQTDPPWSRLTTANLHHVGEAPYRLICPVTLVWKPVLSAQVGSLDGAEESMVCLWERDLWLWVHPAAFEEAFGALHNICCKLNLNATVGCAIRCFSRKGDLGRLDLTGAKSFEVLKRVIFPVYRGPKDGKYEAIHYLSQLLTLELVDGKAVVHMEVSDPRLKQSERCLAFGPALIPSLTGCRGNNSKGLDSLEEGDMMEKERTTPWEQDPSFMFGASVEEMALCRFCCDQKAFDMLWACKADGSNSGVTKLPMKDKFLSKMRHTERLDMFGLTQIGPRKDRVYLERNMERLVCPVVLLRHNSDMVSALRWSLILPLNWVSAFWVPLVFAGGHVIGTREQHWVYTDAGLPSFPEDFPDSKAYTGTRATSVVPCREMACEGLTEVGVPIVSGPSKGRHDSSLGGRPSDFSTRAQANNIEQLTGCFVARTKETLLGYLQATHCTSLLAFPTGSQANEEFNTLARHLHQGTIAWQEESNRLDTPVAASKRNNLCLLRVSLRPFRKGVVKSGTTVYAPTSEEYSTWFGMKKAIEKSVPDSYSLEGALGFVTSTAPRGSKTRAGIAFCDATALGLVRGRQCAETTRHKSREIYLMFCNQGSTTLRPAFGSIFLEERDDTRIL